jgi:hypothetical protein
MNKGLRIFLIVLIVTAVAYMGYVLYSQHLEISNLTQENQNTQQELLSAQDQIAELENEKSSLQGRNDDLYFQLRDKESELSTIKDRIVCTDQPSIDLSYTSNSKASSILKYYVGEIVGSVDSAEWEVIWTDSKTAIHYLASDEYLVTFIVYFDEKELNSKKGIFWVARQCWLNGK